MIDLITFRARLLDKVMSHPRYELGDGVALFMLVNDAVDMVATMQTPKPDRAAAVAIAQEYFAKRDETCRSLARMIGEPWPPKDERTDVGLGPIGDTPTRVEGR